MDIELDSELDIESLAESLSKSALIHLVTTIYGRDDEVDAIIERNLLSRKKNLKHAHSEENIFSTQIAQIKYDDEYIDYYLSGEFAFRLNDLLSDIDCLLSEEDLELALRTTEEFLDLANHVFERVDDSDGEVADVFRAAIDLWLELATELRAEQPDAENWIERVLGYFDNNEYGCFDDILSHSGELLNQQELQQLAWRFENEARQALADPAADESYNDEAAHACIGLEAVAVALGNMALFEKATLLTSPQPNAMQMASIVNFALRLDDQQQAQFWLDQPGWESSDYQRKSLINQLLEQQGNYEQIKQNYLDDFKESPHDFTLRQFWEVANEVEKEELKPFIERSAEGCSDLSSAINMLIIIDRPKSASEVLLKKTDELQNYYYTNLLSWADFFEHSDQTLATILCYRALLTDLLDRGYSKAYHHGARYFHKLLALDKNIDDYAGLVNAQGFVEEIQNKHWRKRSFWAEADYPNKPTH